MGNFSERLRRQMEFIIEADKVKNIFRRSYISDKSRRENDAEHSWHLCLMAITLAEHSKFKSIDILKVLKMVVIHDLVEIDAGDTYIYDEEAKKDQALREQKAAERIFGILPNDQAKEYRELWDEFEAAESDEAIFSKSLDRLHPMLLNALAEGKTWAEHDITESQVRQINSSIEDGSEALWNYADDLIEQCVDRGWLPRTDDGSSQQEDRL